MDIQNPIAVQHQALKDLIDNIYGLNIKGFLTDAAEIIENRSDSDQLIEHLWECAQMCPNDPSRP